ncbi:hypothetical protein ACIPZ8_22675 [Pseudomonas sp. NPDC089422]|uniref:hypothetical protein n=1 Tax=Pseudomonas sp. NPDC089422 TaxID=3364466 RepID=UPI0038146236
MPVFEILPLHSVGPARLGATRVEVRQAMDASGFPLQTAHGNCDYFSNAAMQIEYGADDKALFIGVSGGAAFRVVFKGVDVFNLPANEVFALMADADGSGPHDFNSDEYCFPNQILTLWDADEQYDRDGDETRPIWAQVGIGSGAYLAAIVAIDTKA